MPRLVDTTIRVLSQEPLAGAIPTAELLRLAEILDRARFASLEVSGGGVFDACVRRGVESPWERIRGIKARVKTPLALAVRGRFLVGPRPVSDELVRRFVLSAAASGIDIFRLNDPLNDVDNLRVAAEAIREAGCEFDCGLIYGSQQHGALLSAAAKLPELGAARVVLHDAAGLLQPHRASVLVKELREASGLPVGIYCQGAGGNALAATLEGARAGADLMACAVYPVALSMLRVSAEAAAQALAGIGLDPGVDLVRPGAEGPVGRREQKQAVPRPVALADLEDDLLGRDDVAAMTIEQHEPPEPVADEVFEQAGEQVEVHTRPG